jgi:hypothetical protein
MRHRSSLALALPAFLALGATAASCNLVLGLDAFIDCPEDPKCKALVGTGGATTTGPTGGSGGVVPDPTCTDGLKNGSETDVDCGGSVCGKCADDKGCANGSDCESKVCTGGTCIAPSCSDTVKNGAETDADCGGGMCGACAVDKGCVVDGDCLGGVCMGGKCAATCTDGVKDGDESDVDCGGATCGKCAIDKGCATGPDCETGVCQASKCVSYHVWSKTFGEAQEQYPAVVTADSLGQSFLFSKITGSVDFGTGLLTAPTPRSLAAAKFDPAGNVLWSKMFNAHTGLFGSGVAAAAVDPYGDVAFTGVVDGAADFGGGPPPGTWGNGNMFVAKLDPAGGHMWTKEFALTSGGGIGFHLTDHTVVAGSMASASTNFGCGALPTSGANGEDIFVASFDYVGACVWSKRFGNDQFNTLASLATDMSGNVAILGSVAGTLNFGAGAITGPVGDPAIFVTKFKSNGAAQWSRAFGPVGMQGSFNKPVSVAAGQAGVLYVTGTFRDTIDFGDGLHTASATQDIFLVKLDGSGNTIWSKTYAGGDAGDVGSISVDSMDNVVVVGAFASAIDFGDGSIACTPGLTCAFVVKLDSLGNHIWSRSFGTAMNAAGVGVTSGGGGSAIVTGRFVGSIDLGGGSAITKGGNDIFLAKLLVP